MSEQWQTGNPEQEGWYECEWKRYDQKIFLVVNMWRDSDWWICDDAFEKPFGVPVFRWRGPLILAPEPSQGASVEEICSRWIHKYETDQVGFNGLIDGVIAEVNQSAYERGKEEGRQSGIRQAIVTAQKTHAWNTGEFVDFKHQGSQRMRDQIVSDLQKLLIGQTDPPAQPAEAVLSEDQQRLAKRVMQAIDDYELGRKAGKEEGRREAMVAYSEWIQTPSSKPFGDLLADPPAQPAEADCEECSNTRTSANTPGYYYCWTCNKTYHLSQQVGQFYGKWLPEKQIQPAVKDKYGFDRKGLGSSVTGRGFPCNCRWASSIHGDICPEHGAKGVPLTMADIAQPAATEPEKRPPLTKEIATAIWANLEPGSRIQEGMAILTDYVLDLQQRVKRLEEKE